MHNEFFTNLTTNHPFITVCSYSGQDYVGIIQNRDDVVTTMYDYGAIVTNPLREKFLELGDIWWWESNRCIPINMFLRERFSGFRQYLKTFARKDTTIIQGPIVNLKDMMNKRVKRRTIQLVRSD